MTSPGWKTSLALTAILATLIASGWVAWKTDLQFLDPAGIRDLGVPAMAGYTVGMMILGGFGVPPVLLMVPTVAVWSFPVALAVCLTGGLGASVVGFLLSRYCMRETFAPKIPPKIARYEHRLETHGISTVLILRLLFYLFPPINWMLGISAIPLSIFVGATLAGILPGTVVYLLTGKGVIAFLAALSTLQALCLTGISAGVLYFWWRWATGDDEEPGSSD